MQPSYQSGFYAPGRGVAKHPELWRGCVGAWNPGLGNTGLSLRDWSGGQNNGTLTNGPTWGVSDGQQALTFNGTNYVTCSRQITNQVNGTYTAWVRWTSQNGSVFGSTTTRSYIMLLYPSVNSIYCGDGTTNNVLWPYTPVDWDNKWKAIAVRKTGSTLEMFFEGVNQGSRPLPTITPIDFIGRGQGGTYSWGGQIDDARIYNRALSDNEIRTLAQRPGIAYELAPRKTYFIPTATSTSQFYDILSPLIFAGTN